MSKTAIGTLYGIATMCWTANQPLPKSAADVLNAILAEVDGDAHLERIAGDQAEALSAEWDGLSAQYMANAKNPCAWEPEEGC